MAKLAKYGIRDGASIEEMRKELVRAGKAANQRLRRLETAAAEGRTTGKGMSYTYAMKYLSKMGRTRFKERAARMKAQDVQTELAQIHAFLHGHQSTVTGIKESEKRRYQTYLQLGYKGSLEEFINDAQTIFALLEEKGFGYQIGYELLTKAETEEQQRERVSKWLREIRGSDEEAKGAEGKMLLEVLREKGRAVEKQFREPYREHAEDYARESHARKVAREKKKHRRGR